MTVKEFYDAAGGGYETMIAKFASDVTITAFLKIFQRDKSYESLCEKLDGGDAEGAFVAAHTLKGVVLNLNIEGLMAPVCNITEALRAGNISEARTLLPEVKAAYERTVEALSQLLQ